MGNPLFDFDDELRATASQSKLYLGHRAASGVVAFGELKVDMALLLKGGLSYRAYAGVDLQSDLDCSKKLNTGYLSGWVWGRNGVWRGEPALILQLPLPQKRSLTAFFLVFEDTNEAIVLWETDRSVKHCKRCKMLGNTFTFSI